MSRPRGRFARSKARQGDSVRHQIPFPCPHSTPPPTPTGFTLMGALMAPISILFHWRWAVIIVSVLNVIKCFCFREKPSLSLEMGASWRDCTLWWRLFRLPTTISGPMASFIWINAIHDLDEGKCFEIPVWGFKGKIKLTKHQSAFINCSTDPHFIR